MPTAVDHRPRKFIGAVEDGWQLYSNRAADYTIGLPIGFGASSVVYAAKYQPTDGERLIPCALKVLDLDRLPPSALRLLQNETQLMSLSKHPNVLRVRGTWVLGHKLYIAMRLMNAGSVADVMRYAWNGGLEEEVIRCILKQALEGLNYFHINGLIHRDVKAANLLIDEDGTVLLGDLGVAAFLWDSEGPQGNKSRAINFDPNNRQRSASTPAQRPSILGKRKSFVGTPCWMAPEVIKGKQYDASADIWSFGITALELAQGRAPRSRMDPNQVLLSTVRDAPPHLERTGGAHKYSAAFVEIIDRCLNKDPAKRPTAAELLQMPFFRGAKKPSFLVNAVLRGLPALTKRQERRKQPSVYTHATLESWDFSPSIPASPTTSVYSHMRRPKSLLPQESVFEMESEGDAEGDAEGSDNDSERPALSRDMGGAVAGAGGEDEGDHAAIDGHSKAEAYAVRIRERHRGSGARGLLSHSRSGSHQSLHSVRHAHAHAHSHSHSHSHAHSHVHSAAHVRSHSHHSRHLSHDEPRSTVHSIQEVEVALATDSSDSEPESVSGAHAMRIPVAFSPKKHSPAGLQVPPSASGSGSMPSTSPVPSTHSSASTSAASSSGSPLSSAHAPSGSSSRPRKLWRKLASRLEGDSDREQAHVVPVGSPSPRKRSFGAVFGRTALVGADLVRTASRTMAASKQTR